MADKKFDKKPDKKGGDKKPEAPSGPTPTGILMWAILIIIFLTSFFPFVAKLFGVSDPDGNSVFDPEFISSVRYLGVSVVTLLQSISAFISLLFLIGIIYAAFKSGQVKREAKLMEKVKRSEQKKAAVALKNENRKWKKVLDHVASPNASDWRLAILEADILLDELLNDLEYPGDTLGEKLKAANKTEFQTLNEAWEAHKIRNTIAHQGSDFNLSQREAKRVIGLFEEVFKEFRFIA